MDKPSTVLTINPAKDEDGGLDQATSDLVKKKERGKEDNVEIMVDEGKVLFIPKMKNDDLKYSPELLIIPDEFHNDIEK